MGEPWFQIRAKYPDAGLIALSANFTLYGDLSARVLAILRHAIPTVEPTRSWRFRTIDITATFGEYQPDGENSNWGIDMLAVAPHDVERA